VVCWRMEVTVWTRVSEMVFNCGRWTVRSRGAKVRRNRQPRIHFTYLHQQQTKCGSTDPKVKGADDGIITGTADVYEWSYLRGYCIYLRYFC
jgi:hypothetical protein